MDALENELQAAACADRRAGICAIQPIKKSKTYTYSGGCLIDNQNCENRACFTMGAWNAEAAQIITLATSDRIIFFMSVTRIVVGRIGSTVTIFRYFLHARLSLLSTETLWVQVISSCSGNMCDATEFKRSNSRIGRIKSCCA